MAPQQGVSGLSSIQLHVAHPDLAQHLNAVVDDEELISQLVRSSADMYCGDHDVYTFITLGDAIPLKVTSFAWPSRVPKNTEFEGVFVTDFPGKGTVLLARKPGNNEFVYRIWEFQHQFMSEGYHVLKCTEDERLATTRTQIEEDNSDESSGYRRSTRKRKVSSSFDDDTTHQVLPLKRLVLEKNNTILIAPNGAARHLAHKSHIGHDLLQCDAVQPKMTKKQNMSMRDDPQTDSQLTVTVHFLDNGNRILGRIPLSECSSVQWLFAATPDEYGFRAKKSNDIPVLKARLLGDATYVRILDGSATLFQVLKANVENALGTSPASGNRSILVQMWKEG